MGCFIFYHVLLDRILPHLPHLPQPSPEHQVFGAPGLNTCHLSLGALTANRAHRTIFHIQHRQWKAGRQAGRHTPRPEALISRINYGELAQLCHNVSIQAWLQGLRRPFGCLTSVSTQSFSPSWGSTRPLQVLDQSSPVSHTLALPTPCFHRTPANSWF